MWRWPAFAALLTVLAAGCAAGTVKSAEDDAPFTGRLSTVVTDTHETFYGLEVDGQLHRLDTQALPPEGEDGFDWRTASNTKVRVFGEASADGTIEATRIAPFVSDDVVQLTEAELTTGTRKVLFISVSFDGGQPLTSLDDIRGKAADTAWRYNTASFGALTMSYDVVGPYNISFGGCGDTWRWTNDAKAIAQRNGINLSQYSHVSLVVRANCGWAGLGEQPGTLTWLANTDVGVYLHELGHNFGNFHASTRACTNNGQRVPMSDSCSMDEYGDRFDCMGNTYSRRQFNAEYKAQLGWIPGSRIATASAGQTYTITPSNLPSSGIQLLNINGSNGVVYGVEFRQPANADSFSSSEPATNGVSIRARFTRAGDSSRTHLLDMTPGTSSWDDSPLASGKSYTFFGTDTTLQVVSTSPAGAVVKVTTGGSGGGTGGGSGGVPNIGTTARALKAVSSGKCLSIANRSTSNGAGAVQRTCSATTDQIWTPVAQADGTYTLVNKASGRCLDVMNASTADGAALGLWDCHGNTNQRWRFVAGANGAYTVVSASSNKCMDVFGWSTADNSQIGQWTCFGNANQLFTLQ